MILSGAIVLALVYVSAATAPLLLMALEPLGPVSHFGRLYAKPLVLGALLGVIWLAARPAEAKVVPVVAGCAVLGLVYTLVDMVHYGASDGLLQLVKDTLYNKVAASFFVAAVIAGLVMWSAAIDHARSARTVTLTGLGLALVSAVMSIGIQNGSMSLGGREIVQNNSLAYESIGVMLLALFLWQRVLTVRVAVACVLVGAAVQIVHGTRGGMLAALYLLIGYLAMRVREAGWRSAMRQPVVRSVLVASVVLVLGLGGLFTGGPGLRSDPGSSVRLSRALQLLARSTQFRLNFDSNDEISLDDDVVSAYSRLATTILALKAFAHSPVIGVGIWNAYSDIEVANFGIHGLLPLILAAYGLIGLIPLAGLLTFGGVHRPRDGLVAIHLLIVVLMVATLLNVYPWWLGVAAWAYGHEPAAEAVPAGAGAGVS